MYNDNRHWEEIVKLAIIGGVLWLVFVLTGGA